MKYNKNIVERNLKDAMEYFQSIGNNYLSTFKKVEANLFDEEFHSIKSNYIALFLHQMMKKKVNIEEFDTVIQHIYHSNKKIEPSLYRFFGGTCCDISLTEYLKLQKPGIKEEEKTYSIWNELSYFLYDIKNNSYGLDQDKIPYLESMVKFIPEKRIDELYSSGFVTFLVLVTHNADDLVPILQSIQSNKAFDGSVVSNNKSFFSLFFRGLSDQSYNMTEENKINLFQSYYNSLNNFEELFLNQFLAYYPTDKYRKFDFNLGMSNFLHVVGSDKVFKHIDKVYKSIVSKEQYNNSRKNPYDIELDVASEMSSSLQVSFDKKEFEVDYNIIDTDKPLLSNFIYIKLLDVQLMTGKSPKVEKPIRKYIMKEFSIDDSGPWPELDSLLKKKEIIKYFEYLDMADELTVNPSNKSRVKM